MRKLSRILSIVLVVCILLCCASSAFAVEKKNYDTLFAKAAQNFTDVVAKNITNAIAFDTENLIWALAYQNATVQEAVIDGLLSSITTDTQRTVVFCFAELVADGSFGRTLTPPEQTLIDALIYAGKYSRFVSTAPQEDLFALFERALTTNEGASEGVMYNLAQVLVSRTDYFLRCLAQEDEQTRDAVFTLLTLYKNDLRGTFMREALNDLLDSSYTLSQTQKDYVDYLLTVFDNAPKAQYPVGPAPEDFSTPQPEPAVPDYNYDALFSAAQEGVMFDGRPPWVDAFLLDTQTCIRELAFREVDVQESVIQALCRGMVSREQRVAILFLLQELYLPEMFLTKSEQALLPKLLYELEFWIIGTTYMPHRSYAILFAHSDAEYLRTELAYALSGSAIRFVYELSQAHTQYQEDVVATIGTHYGQTVHGAVMAAQLADARGAYELPDDEKQLAIVDSLLDVLQDVPLSPALTGPDPDELAQWLAQKQEQETLPDEPTIHVDPTYIFTYPVVTQPETDAASDTQSAPADSSSENKPQNRFGWLAILCLSVAATAIAFGLVQRRKTRKKTSAASAETIASVPTVIACPAPLSEYKKAQITAALREHYREYHIDWYREDNPQGTTRCYGSDNGYDILFYAGGFRLTIAENLTIAGETFYYDTAFELLAYKDGNLTALQKAFEEGFVSKEAIAEVLKLHEQCQ